MTPRETWQKFNSFQQKMEVKYIPQVRKVIKQAIDQWLKDNPNFRNVDDLSLSGLVPVFSNLYYQCGYGYGWSVYKQFANIKSSNEYLTKADTTSALVTPESIAQEVLNELRFSLLVNVAGITDTVKERILYWIEQGLINGYGYEKTARLITDVADIVRARRIVRTESVKAANLAAIAGAKDTGLLMDKRWISARDNRVRGNPAGKYPHAAFDHWDINGQVIPIDELFTMTGEPLLHPGDPKGSAGDVINCRCSLGFIPKRDANGKLIRTRPGYFVTQRDQARLFIQT